MKITKIKKRYGENRNLGNYESMRAEVELEAELEAGDDVAQVNDFLLNAAKNLVKRDFHNAVR